jgi:hypothetical protein
MKWKTKKYPNVGKFRKEKKNHRNKMENKYYPIVVTINCNHFNFGRISMKCELVGARKTDSKTNLNYDVYSQC